MKTYTIGEIFRLKLLKNSSGQPYSSKGSISNVLKGVPHTVKPTPHGMSKLYSESTIAEINKRWD